jgi:hypothetical protein
MKDNVQIQVQRQQYEHQIQVQQQQHEQQIQVQQQQHEQQIQVQQQQHEQQIQVQRQQHEQQIQDIKDEYEDQIHDLETQIHNLKNQIDILRDQLVFEQDKVEKYHNQIFEIAKQPNQVTNHTNSQTTNNRILNITNHLIPIETDEEIQKMIDNQYTRDIFLGGSDSLKDMTVSILKDQETGKYRTVCSDASRSVFYYLDNENNLIKDIGMKNIHKKIQKPLFAATSLHYKEIDRDGSIDDDKLCEIFSDNINFIDHELPTRLKPELQIPVNLSQNLIK